MKATVVLVLAVATLAVGCGASSSSDRPSASSSGPVASPTTPPAAGLVGRWERVTTCQELVRELDQAGLGPLTPYAWLGATSSTGESSFAPGSPKPTSAHPCTGALPRVHSHFFTQSGQFGSLDWLGGQVDEDPYRIVNETTVRIGSPGGGVPLPHSGRQHAHAGSRTDQGHGSKGAGGSEGVQRGGLGGVDGLPRPSLEARPVPELVLIGQ